MTIIPSKILPRLSTHKLIPIIVCGFVLGWSLTSSSNSQGQTHFLRELDNSREQKSVIQLQNPKKQTPDDCVKFRTEVRYRSGYEHWVHIKNKCSSEVKCLVKTDTCDDENHLRIAAGKSESVLTFRGSPARQFKASVTCNFSDPAMRPKGNKRAPRDE